LNSLFDRQIKVYYVTQVLKQGTCVLTSKRTVLTTYSYLETRTRLYSKSI